MKLAPNELQHDNVYWIDPRNDIWGILTYSSTGPVGYYTTAGLS